VRVDKGLGDFLERLSSESGGLPISIDEAQAATQLSRAAVLDRFRRLQERGEGYLKLGRHGHPTRFYLRSKSVAAPAPEMPLRLAAPVAAESPPPVRDAHSDAPAPMIVTYSFRLRGDLDVTLELPADLTEREAGRLAGFIETLPL
jgi:hypothetical protein